MVLSLSSLQDTEYDQPKECTDLTIKRTKQLFHASTKIRFLS